MEFVYVLETPRPLIAFDGAVLNNARDCWREVDEVNDRPVGNPKRRFD
jgi:hypothetical protein